MRRSGRPIVVACDRDVDSLSAAVLVARALDRMGASEVDILPAGKGEHVYKAAMRMRIMGLEPSGLIVIDMGCRPEPILLGLPTLFLQHDQARTYPLGAVAAGGPNHPTTAGPTSLLAYEVVRGLAPMEDQQWLALLGAVADLGRWLTLPGMSEALQRYGRATLAEAVNLINTARRAHDHDVILALSVLLQASSPEAIVQGTIPGVRELRRCRVAVRAELERFSHVTPRIAGRFGVVHIASGAQVHPLLATRWSHRFKQQIIIVANHGYVPGLVDVAIRTQLPINVRDALRELAPPAPTWPVLENEQPHAIPTAAGASMPTEEFELMLEALDLRPGPEPECHPPSR